MHLEINQQIIYMQNMQNNDINIENKHIKTENIKKEIIKKENIIHQK